jgi:hypothetical protein
MSKHMPKVIIALVFCGMVSIVAMAFAEEPAKTITAQEAFAMLKGLAGEWQGKAMDKDNGPSIAVTYRVTANNSVVLETLFPGTEHEMLTLYHLDNGKLVLTHYCAMGNQPRMELDPASSADHLIFNFAGGSNLDPAKDMHMHSGRVCLVAPDRLENEWDTFRGTEKVDTKKFFLERKK